MKLKSLTLCLLFGALFASCINDIFKDDFKTVTFAMYPIYLNLSFGYTF